MWISDTSIKRPVFATMTILSFVVLGLVSMGRLGIDLFPEVNFPFINVGVVFPGAAPEEVESLVTQRIEDAVSGINGVKRVISTSTEGFSRVGVELRLEVDAQAAAAEVREKVAAIRGTLPPDIEDPTIQRFDVAALPVMVYAVGSTQPSDRVRRQVEDDLKPLLEQIDGVAAVEINGGQIREIQVNLDPRRLEALGMPITEVAGKLAAENLDLPGGNVERDGRSVTLRTKGEFQSASEIADVILRSEGGSTVRVRDVGTVVDGFEDRKTTTRLDGADAVSFSVRKQSGANTVEITDRVAATIARLEADRSLPDLQIRPVHNDADFIKENVRDVRGHILFGGAMAVMVIFLFMRDWRSTLITALALPTSVIATFFFMYVVGFTFNMMSLMALSLVIGILIDDAVVVRENIFRHMEMGKDPTTAAREGTAEIGLAVMATTFTILAVFLPVGFMTGIVGQFFKQFALTIAFAVAMSLLVAFTLDPMLSSRFVRFIPPEERRRTRMGRFLENWGALYDRLDQQYHRLLGWAIDHPWSVVATAALVFFGSLSTLTVIGTEFVPFEDRGQMEVLVELPAGTSFEQSEAAVAGVETVVRGIPEVRQIFTTVGVNGDPLRARLQVKTTSKLQRERGLLAIKADARARLADVRMMKATVTDPEFMQGAPSEAPVNIFVRGDDMVALQRLSDEIVSKVRQVRGAVDVDSTLEGGQPEMVAQVNRSMAADLGFEVATVASQLRGMVEGVVPTKLRDGEEEYDIRVRLAPEYRNDFAVIARTPLYSPRGVVGAHGRHRDHGARRRPDQHRARAAPAAGQDRHRARRPRARRRHHRPRHADGRRADAAELRVGLCRRRRDDAGVSGGHGPRAAAGRGLHLHRAGVAVRVVLRAAADHALAAPGSGRRPARHARHRQQPRHAGDDRRGDADGPRDQERHSAGRPHEPLPPRRRAVDARGLAQGRSGTPAAHPDDDLRHDPGHDAVGHGHRRRRGVPRADLDCHDWRSHHLHRAHPGGRAGGLPAAGPPDGATDRPGAARPLAAWRRSRGWRACWRSSPWPAGRGPPRPTARRPMPRRHCRSRSTRRSSGPCRPTRACASSNRACASARRAWPRRRPHSCRAPP